MSVTPWRMASAAGCMVVVAFVLVWGASKAFAIDCATQFAALSSAQAAYDSAASVESTANDAYETQMGVVDAAIATASGTLNVPDDYVPTTEYITTVETESGAIASADATANGLLSDDDSLQATANSAFAGLVSAKNAVEACLNP